MKPKIIHIMHLLLDNSSAWPLVENQIKGLDKTLFKQTICYLCGDVNHQSPLVRQGHSVINLGIPKKKLRRIHCSLIFSLKKIITDLDIDIVHCQRHKPTVYGSLSAIMAGKRTRVITTVHGRNRTRSLNRRLLNFVVLNKTSRIIAVSEAVKGDICNANWLCNPDKVVTVYNGIDADGFNSPLSKDEARSQLGLPGTDTVIFGTVGRLTKVKAHAVLLNAFKEVAAKHGKSFLVIAGTGQLDEDLHKQAQDLGIGGRVIFLGQRQDIAVVLRAFDFFVLPSLSEGHPLVLLEAMAAGLPLIATNVGGIPEILCDPHPAKLINPGSVTDLYEAMNDIYNMDDQERIEAGKALRERVMEKFTLENMVSSMTALYQQVYRKR